MKRGDGVGLLLASLVVMLAGVGAALMALDPKVVIDRDSEWREVWLRATSTHGLPMLLQRVVLEREARASDRVLQVLPLGVGLAVLLLLARRLPVGIALVFALASLACAVLAIQALHDPVALLEFKAAPRQRAQT